jgi:hypothetical protein
MYAAQTRGIRNGSGMRLAHPSARDGIFQVRLCRLGRLLNPPLGEVRIEDVLLQHALGIEE